MVDIANLVIQTLIGIAGSAENVGVSRSGDAPPKAARVNGESRR